MEWRVKSSQEGNHPIVNAYHLHTILVPLQPCKVCAANLPFSARCSSDLTAVLLAKILSDQVHHLLRALHDPPSSAPKTPKTGGACARPVCRANFLKKFFRHLSSNPNPSIAKKGKNFVAVRAIRRCPASHFSPEGTKEDGEKKRENKVACIAGANFPGWGGARHVAKSCGRGQARRYPAHRQPNPLLPDLQSKDKNAREETKAQ